MADEHMTKRTTFPRTLGIPVALGVGLLLAFSSLVAGAPLAQAVSPDLVISQVYGGGGSSAATPFCNDAIELFNRGTNSVSLANKSVQYGAATGNFGSTAALAFALPAASVAPGAYFLVQAGSATTGACTPLPSPDATSTGINMSATAGKVALVDGTLQLQCGSATAPCGPSNTPRADGQTILDRVAYGAATDPETTPAAALTNQTSAKRTNECVDTDNNSVDFVSGTPLFRGACSGNTGPTSTPTSTATPGGSPTATPVPARIHDIQGAAHRSPLEGTTVANVFGIVTFKHQTGVSGGQPVYGFFMQDAPDQYDADDRTAEGILVFTSADPISRITVGDAVRVTGSVSEFRSGGASSANLTTTELNASDAGITLVSSGNPLPPATIVGVGGRTTPSQVIDDDPGASIETGATFDPATDGIDFYESLEGMRLRLDNPVAVSRRTDFPSSGTQELVVLPDNGSTATIRSARGGVILRCLSTIQGDVSHCDSDNDGTPDGGIDFNPERVVLQAPSPDSTAVASAPPTMSLLNVDTNVGDQFPGVVDGVLDYNFGNFKLMVTAVPPRVSGGLTREVTSLSSGAPDRLTIASFNVENLDPADPPDKFAGLANVIVHNLLGPDILGLEEIQDNNGPTDDGVVDADVTLNTLRQAIVDAGGPNYEFRQINPINDQEGGEPGGNIRVGFFFNPNRVQFVDRSGPGSTPTGTTTAVDTAGVADIDSSPGRLQDPDIAAAVYPGGLANAFTASRRPLVGEFTFNGNTVFVIGNHWDSKGGDDPLFGRFQPPSFSSENQRREQARIVRDFVTSLLDINPATNIVVMGDLNDYQFSRPLSILETLEGALPASLRLNNLIETLPENERYTYVFDGNTQTLDGGIVASSSLTQPGRFEFDVVHVNAEFQDQVSDHDPQIGRFEFPPKPLDVGGRGFGLSISTLTTARLTWRAGRDQASYVLVRTRARTGAVNRFTLPANTTTFSDTPPLPWTTYCYALQAVDKSGHTLAQSDVVCFRPRTGFGSEVPADFSAKLDESNAATLNWGNASHAGTSYVLLALAADGAAPRVSVLPAGTQSRTDNTRGVATCYILFSLRGGAFPSRTDTTCVVPGQSTFDKTTTTPANLSQVDQVNEITTPPTP
jgi:uncharacterized protein